MHVSKIFILNDYIVYAAYNNMYLVIIFMHLCYITCKTTHDQH